MKSSNILVSLIATFAVSPAFASIRCTSSVAGSDAQITLSAVAASGAKQQYLLKVDQNSPLSIHGTYPIYTHYRDRGFDLFSDYNGGGLMHQADVYLIAKLDGSSKEGAVIVGDEEIRQVSCTGSL